MHARQKLAQYFQQILQAERVPAHAGADLRGGTRLERPVLAVEVDGLPLARRTQKVHSLPTFYPTEIRAAHRLNHELSSVFLLNT